LKWPRVVGMAWAAGIAGCLVGAVHRSAWAIETRRAPLLQALESIESCVSHDRIRFANEGRSAILDAGDHRLVRAEMVKLYPMIANDGMPSTRTILWQKPAGDLVYVAVFDNPDGSGQACFTATFAAGQFELTLLLRRKYLVPSAPAN